MVLGSQEPGRVGRRRFIPDSEPPARRLAAFEMPDLEAIDPGLASALGRQLAAWRGGLASGAERVGWKLGMGDRERIGAGPVIGYLTSASQLPPGGVYGGSGGQLVADAEIALV